MRPVLLLCAFVAPLCLPTPTRAATEAETLFAQGKILRTQDLREGMRGVGKTVFHGTRIDTFNIEVVGVLEGVNSGGDLILIRVLDGPVVERKTGIIAGMSGSPVYIEGKLIGAIAYAWSDSLEPLGGVSPIEEMLESFEPRAAGKSTQQAAVPLRDPLRIGARTFRSVAVRSFADSERGADDLSTLELRPVRTPMLVNGFRDLSFPALEKLLGPFGFEPVQGPGGRKAAEVPELEPGSALGIDLVSGDLSMSTVGTLTYRDGDRVLAFGHPFLGTGRGLAPMTACYVHAILPRSSRSMKMASTIQVVGALTQDWVAAVGGVLGRQAPTIPVRLVARDSERGRERVYDFSVVDHKDLTPSLVIGASLDAFYNSYGAQSDGTVSVEMRAEGEGIDPIVRRNLAYTRGEFVMPAVLELADAVANLTDNPFERVKLTRLELTAELQRTRRVAEINRVTVSPTQVKPGDELRVEVELKPQEGKSVSKAVTFTIPEGTPGGTLRVGVAPGSLELYLRQRLGLYLPQVDKLDQLLWLWRQIGSNSEVRVKVGLPVMGAAVEGQQLPGLPVSVLQVMRATRGTGMRFPLEGLSQSFDTDWDLGGRVHLVSVRVLGKRSAVSPSSPARPPSPRQPPPSSRDEQASFAFWQGNPTPPTTTLWRQVRALGLYDATTVQEERPAPAQTGGSSPKTEEAGRDSTPPAPPRTTSGKRSSSGSGPKPPAKPKRQGLARPNVAWRSAGVGGFLTGEHHHTCVSSAGDLRIAPVHREVLSVEGLYVWKVAAAPDGAAYAAVANSGEIYRIPKTGAPELLVDTEAAAVYALTVAPDGKLIAGLSPGGRLVQYDAQGKATLLCQLPDQYVWDLLWESDDTLLIATGSAGKVYRLKRGGQPEVAWDLPQRHVRRMRRASDGRLYASTSDVDVLCRLEPDGNVHTLFESEEGEVLGLAAGKEGALYFSTARKGNVYQWHPSGAVTTYFESSQSGSFDLIGDAAGNLYLATTGSTGKGIVYKVDPHRAGMRVLEPEQAQALSLALTPDDRLIVGLGNLASVQELSLQGGAQAWYESPVHDAKRLSRWGTVNWVAETPAGGEVRLAFRSGNTANPDESWSDWEQPSGAGSVWRVPSPASRFLQFRVELQAGEAGTSPRLRSVNVVYLPRNQSPTVSIQEPPGGARWSGKQTIRWKGTDPDDDPLQFRLLTLAEGSETWTELTKKDGKATSSEFDTRDLDDGTYRLKIEADDSLGNPNDALTGDAVTEPFVVDNTAPFVVFSRETTVTPNGGVSFRVVAVDQLSRVTSAEYRIDQGKWRAAQTVDGIFDASAEDIVFTIEDVSGEHTLEVRVRDEAGNLTTKRRIHQFGKAPKP